MKTLKFMLAAATAIGLASASQAAGPYNGSTSFETDTLGYLTNSTAFSTSYWTVPAGAEDADYTVVEATPDSNLRSAGAISKFGSTNEQVLQLEGGTEPLLRNIQATGTPVDLSAGDVYIDTLVKFTVTPAGDTVEAGANDKLMIYLQEMTNEVGAVTGTNLVVLAALYTPADGWTDLEPTFTPTRALVANAVEAGVWYRLQVKSYVENGIALFTIKLNGNDLVSSTPLYTDVEKKIFPSLQGKTSTSLASVGFAGSGAVDDLLFTTFDPGYTVIDFYLALVDNDGGIPGDVSYSTSGDSGNLGAAALTADGQQIFCAYDAQGGATPSVTVTYTVVGDYTAAWSNGTSANGNDTFTPASGQKYTLTVTPVITAVDFTFALGTGVSGVTWTLNGDSASGTVKVKEGDALAITAVTYDPWYVGAGDYVAGWSKTLAAADVGADFSYTVTATSTADGTIPAGTTPADLGIDSAATGITAADLSKVAKWAADSSKGGGSVSAANAIRFSDQGEATNDVAEAYLLNCAVSDLVTEKANFKFTSFDPSNPPDNTYFDAKGYNGTVTIKGATVLGTWHDKASGDKFFKATLTK